MSRHNLISRPTLQYICLTCGGGEGTNGRIPQHCPWCGEQSLSEVTEGEELVIGVRPCLVDLQDEQVMRILKSEQ